MTFLEKQSAKISNIIYGQRLGPDQSQDRVVAEKLLQQHKEAVQKIIGMAYDDLAPLPEDIIVKIVRGEM